MMFGKSIIEFQQIKQQGSCSQKNHCGDKNYPGIDFDHPGTMNYLFFSQEQLKTNGNQTDKKRKPHQPMQSCIICRVADHFQN